MGKIQVLEKEIEIKEYRGVRVVTVWDIAELHDKEVKAINQQFKRNFSRFEENKDYFQIEKEKFSESISVTQKFIPNNVKYVALFTERGYLKLSKTFNDDISWKVQDILVDSYFKLKEIVNNFRTPKNYIEALEFLIESEKEKEQLKIQNKEHQKALKQKDNRIEEMLPKEDYYDRVIDIKESVGIGKVAKTINFVDYEKKDIGRNKLFKILKENSILDSYNIPYQRYINSGYFEVKQSFNKHNGSLLYTTLVTPKGINYIIKLLRKLNYKEKDNEKM